MECFSPSQGQALTTFYGPRGNMSSDLQGTGKCSFLRTYPLEMQKGPPSFGSMSQRGEAVGPAARTSFLFLFFPLHGYREGSVRTKFPFPAKASISAALAPLTEKVSFGYLIGH